MKRKPTYLRNCIGSVSSGTMRDEDLIPEFAWHLRQALKTCRINRNDRKRYVALVNECNQWCDANDEDRVDRDMADGSELVSDLFDALNDLAPPYCFFGAVEGDGAGFWPITEDEHLPRLTAGDEIPWDHWGEDVYLVSDHGNVSCGRFDKRGRWHEYWSAAALDGRHIADRVAGRRMT